MLFGYAVAILLAVISLGGLRSPAYAHETSAWAAQAVAQDWFDLWIAAPVIATAAAKSILGSARARYVLLGGLLYAAYTAAIYCFSIHFNALFLVYCATLGASVFGIVMIGAELGAEPGHECPQRVRKLAAGVMIAIAVGFAGLWLGQIVPGLWDGEPPPEVKATGLATNPVHVLDLAIVLPLHVVVGVAMWRGNRRGLFLGPPLLAFGALMAGSMSLILFLETGGLPIAIGFAALAVLECGLVVGVLFRRDSLARNGCRDWVPIRKSCAFAPRVEVLTEARRSHERPA